MKKIRIFAILLAMAFVAAASIFISCKKECSKCEVQQSDLKEKIAFNLMDKSIQKEHAIYKMSMREGYYRELLDQSKSDENFFRFIEEYCLSKNIPIDEHSMFIVLYYNSPVTQTFTVTEDNIQGVSLFCIEKRKIMHHLFIKNDKAKFYEVENTRVPVSYVTHNHIHYYLENYVFENPQNKSYIMVSGNLFEDVCKNIKKYYRAPMRFEVKNSTRAQQTGTEEETRYCGSPCTHLKGYCYILKENGIETSYYCSESACVATQAQTELLQESQTLTLQTKSKGSAFFDLKLMYAFRNNFLYCYEKGEEYIDNYYYLSEEYQKGLTFSLALQTALFFKDFNSVMKAFLNPEEHLNEIMFTDDLTNSLLKLLDEYEKITKSSEGKVILTSIRKDVHSFKGKQLQEVLAMIK